MYIYIYIYIYTVYTLVYKTHIYIYIIYMYIFFVNATPIQNPVVQSFQSQPRSKITIGEAMEKISIRRL